MYFSTRGLGSYKFGRDEFEELLIVDCFGPERVNEYKGKGKLDVLLILKVHSSLLSFVPGGRDNAVFIQKRAFETLTSKEEDGCFYLRSSAIAACFHVGTKTPEGTTNKTLDLMDKEAELDQEQVKSLYADMRSAATWSLASEDESNANPGMPSLDDAVSDGQPPAAMEEGIEETKLIDADGTGDLELCEVYTPSQDASIGEVQNPMNQGMYSKPVSQYAPAGEEKSMANTAAVTEPWEPHWDEASNRHYYFNRLTHAVTWELPQAAESATAQGTPNHSAPPSLPAPWEEHRDPNSGHSYYFNPMTMETSWTRP